MLHNRVQGISCPHAGGKYPNTRRRQDDPTLGLRSVTRACVASRPDCCNERLTRKLGIFLFLKLFRSAPEFLLGFSVQLMYFPNGVRSVRDEAVPQHRQHFRPLGSLIVSVYIAGIGGSC